MPFKIFCFLCDVCKKAHKYAVFDLILHIYAVRMRFSGRRKGLLLASGRAVSREPLPCGSLAVALPLMAVGRFLSFREAFDAFSSLTGDFFNSDLMCQYHAMPGINVIKGQPIRRYNDRKGRMYQSRKLFEFS